MKHLLLNMILRYVFPLAILLSNCSETPVSGSETTSGVEIAVIETTIHGKTTIGATALIFTTDYSAGALQQFADSTTTDDTGGFLFPDLPEGYYNVFVYSDDSRNSGVALQDIHVTLIDHQDSQTDTGTFTALNTISGTVTLNQQAVANTRIFIPGSSFSTRTDSEGTYTFTSIPDGKYNIVVPSARSWNGGGDTLHIDFSLTKNSTATIDFNLTQ